MTASQNALTININETELSKWSDHRANCDLLSRAFRATPDLRQYADRILACPGLLQPRWSQHHAWQLYPRAACGTKLCPSCNGRFHRPRSKYVKALSQLMAARPRLRSGFAAARLSPDSGLHSTQLNSALPEAATCTVRENQRLATVFQRERSRNATS